MTDHKGLIIISHPILTTITQEEMLAAIPAKWHSMPREIVEVKPINTTLHEVDKIIWSQLAALQRQQVNEQIEPLLKKHPDWAILYFGAAPIPLAIQLGYLLGTWKHFYVYQHNHSSKNWVWGNSRKEKKVKIVLEGVPKDAFEGSGEVILTVQTSYTIAVKDTTDIVKEPIKHVSISTSETGLDIIESPEELEKLAHDFETAFTTICSSFPHATKIHIFGAIPVGLSFLLGTKINPTVSAKIQTYQFHNGREPRYEAAILLQDQGIVLPLITDEEQNAIAALRNDIQKELGRIKTFMASICKGDVNTGVQWAGSILTNEEAKEFSHGRWAKLPTICQTVLGNSEVDVKSTQSTDVYDDRKWMLSDYFLHFIIRRLKDPERIMRAIRLFFFHESLHFETHRLTSSTVSSIGRFPRILEEVDYQADIWAILHEYAFTRHFDIEATKDARKLFSEMINVATETMWAFDETEDKATMQARRISRYLIWYFHLAQLKDDKCNTIVHIMQILAEKPIIDIKGLKTTTDGSQRVICSLKEVKTEDLEIGVLANNVIKRFGSASNLILQSLLTGLSNRDGDAVSRVMQSLYEQAR